LGSVGFSVAKVANFPEHAQGPRGERYEYCAARFA
jgi:hypothetical protein